MSLEEDIRDTLVVDAESALQDNLERVKALIEIYQDGTVVLSGDSAEAGTREQMLAYFIGQRYAAEVDLVESDSIDYEFFYTRFDVDDSRIRHVAGDLRSEGLIEQTEQGTHRIIPEGIPRALDEIEGST